MYQNSQTDENCLCPLKMKDIHFQGDLPSSSEELGACLSVRVNKAAWAIAIRRTAYYILV